MKHVLVVDDSQTIRHELSQVLSAAGYAVVEASDGVAGLERVAETQFAMIILDVNMPRMGGLEMLEQLSLDPKSAKIPVLMLTTEAQRPIIERARRAGAKGWLVKPVKLDLIVTTVAALTERRHDNE
jgi:two-component system chemotaxis response regulator CheY